MQKQPRNAIDRNGPSAYFKLARRYNRTGYYQASEILRIPVDSVPDHALAHYELGFALLQQFSRQRDAIKHLRLSVKISPQLAKAYYFLGWALVRLKRDFVGARALL